MLPKSESAVSEHGAQKCSYLHSHMLFSSFSLRSAQFAVEYFLYFTLCCFFNVLSAPVAPSLCC